MTPWKVAQAKATDPRDTPKAFKTLSNRGHPQSARSQFLPLLVLQSRLLSLHNALRRTALRLGCDILSGKSCDAVHAVIGDDGRKRAALVLTEEGTEEEVVMADFVVGADGLKSVVRAHLGGGTFVQNSFDQERPLLL